ncbi:UDP-galactose-lipid carrier transferase [Bacillus thuringiensis serovar israelensis ATCC 35646]|nr:UDP-galactose-lipid carrier transferase [Bacillus thuringiensis serovar israelensis ATCC 35646]
MENVHLAKVDLTKKIESKSKYNKKLEKYQALLALQQIVKEEQIAVMLVMEGWDAAGKGGAIKRVTGNHLTPRGFPSRSQWERLHLMKNVTIICNVSGAKFHSTGKLTFLIAHGTVVC